MEIVGTQEPAEKQEKPVEEAKAPERKDDSAFSQENLAKETSVKVDGPAGEPLKIGAEMPSVTVTPEEKMAFLDAVIGNTRFTKTYSLFGGRITVKLRSLTLDELNAMAAWAFKQAVADPSWHLSGRGRKYALAAQVEMFNGVELHPLETPLFETLESDGKTTKPPAWVNRDSYWDDKGAGVVDAILNCLADFNNRYRVLYSKAQDENFWNPDTP